MVRIGSSGVSAAAPPSIATTPSGEWPGRRTAKVKGAGACAATKRRCSWATMKRAKSAADRCLPTAETSCFSSMPSMYSTESEYCARTSRRWRESMHSLASSDENREPSAGREKVETSALVARPSVRLCSERKACTSAGRGSSGAAHADEGTLAEPPPLAPSSAASPAAAPAAVAVAEGLGGRASRSGITGTKRLSACSATAPRSTAAPRTPLLSVGAGLTRRAASAK
mmetsp:Transcript_9212/g.20034  ORF Transcript_9212/g.20034 Transcript_9212/m.20034 type:complete len:228 (+) Transcript_9212:1562-2245(+)